MQTAIELKLKEEIAQLKQKILVMEDNFNEVLTNADMAIIETRGDMRIINAEGAIDLIFQEGIDFLERGESLLTVIYKTTHNTKTSNKEVYQNSDEIETIETTINRFVEGTLEEKIIRIVGEKESGELFLLLWKIKRKGKNFKSFFRIVPTNSIIQATADKHKEEIEYMQKLVRDAMNLVEEGIVFLNTKNEIVYMNSAARRFFFGENTSLLKNAPVEGRFFQEIFVNESSDDIKMRIDHIARCISSKKPVSYTKKKHETEVMYQVYPHFNHKRHIDGTITIIKDDLDIFSSNTNPKQELEKMSKALKYYSSIAKKSEARLAELENNQKWLMSKNNEYQAAIKSVYTFLENIPAPIAIISLPSRKYEFINAAFASKFSWTKEYVKGKTDDELFSAEDAEAFSSKILESMDTLEIVKVSTPNFYAKQVVLVNANNKPTNLIRLFL